MERVEENRAAKLGSAACSESASQFGAIVGGITGGITVAVLAPFSLPAFVAGSIAATTCYIVGGKIGRKLGEENGKYTGINRATMGDSEAEIIQHATYKGRIDGVAVGLGVGGAGGYVMSRPEVISTIKTVIDNANTDTGTLLGSAATMGLTAKLVTNLAGQSAMHEDTIY